MPAAVPHLFVLMLENRAFDHMLGFSGISGQDAETGSPTGINGLTGNEANAYNRTTYHVQKGANDVMPVDPGHEFTNVVEQLCGVGATYPSAGAYPAITNDGFVDSYIASGGSADPGKVMRCFDPQQLPVLFALAQEFAICDNWCASMPGPTWPNRMFVHAASSGGLDHSPSTDEIVAWETIGGFPLRNGSIFDALERKGIRRRDCSADIRDRVLYFLKTTAKQLSIALLPVPEVDVIDNYVSNCVSTHAALSLIARLEGIFLDPAYTGKAAAAFIDFVDQKHLSTKDAVLLWHTGGQPGIFS